MEIPFSVNRRKRTARRAFSKCPLFAVQIVSEKLSCDYNSEILIEDLKLKKNRKIKRKKIKPRFDFRHIQLKKLSNKISSTENETERQSLITRYLAMAEADKKRQNIILSVTYQKQTITYSFRWNTNEKIIKDIASIANSTKSFEEFENEKEKYLSKAFSYGN